MSFLSMLFGLQYILIMIRMSMCFGEKMMNFMLTYLLKKFLNLIHYCLSENMTVIPVIVFGHLLYLLIFVENWKYITSALICCMVSQLLVAQHRHIEMISVWDFCLLVLYQFPSSFWCLIEAVCHSYWCLVSVHRSEKYIAVAHFTLALLNLSISCSECSGVFWYHFNFFSGLKVI